MTGFGGGTSGATECYGVSLSGVISAGVNGTVTVTGTGGAGSGQGNHGVLDQGTITSSGGAVLVRGTGGSGGFSGVVVINGGQITAGAAGTVTVEGTAAGGAYGVYVFRPNSAITSSGGAITVTGTEGAGSSSRAVVLEGGAVITHTNNGSITLIGNSVVIVDNLSSVNAGAATVNIHQRSNGVAINLGSTTDASSGPLALSDAELDQITAGTINIGDANTDGITISNAITLTTATNLSLTTKDDTNITFGTSGSLDANGVNVTLTTGGMGAIVSGGATTDITANEITLDGGAGWVGSNGNALTTQGTSISAELSLNGQVYLSEADTINVSSLSAVFSSVNLISGTFRMINGGGPPF